MAESDPLAARAARQESHADLRRRTIAHMQAGTTDLLDGPRPIDPAIYVDPARFEAEKRELFRKRPVCVALSGDIPNPGDKLMVDVLGPAIVLMRGKDGVLRGFLNMCPHRAARLVTECDARSRMTCRFHGWTFDLEGKLIGLPGKEGFAGLEREGLGLIPVPVAEWHGMVYVRADPAGDPIDVADWLGPMAAEMAHLELARARPVKSTVIHAAANWKYAFDTYGENYHFASLHPSTIGALAFSNTMTHQSKGRNFRIGFPRADFADYGARPEAEWPASDYGGLYMLFPSMVFNVNTLPGGGMFYGFSRVFPGETPGTCVTLMTTYRPGHELDERPDEPWVTMHDFIHKVVSTEDYSVSAEGQRNLAFAPEGFRMVFGANEAVLQKNHAEIDRLLAESNEGGAGR
ncbi:MAG: aromatic ring-hydroxylating dioxygenase subunit alpha [Sphingomonadales bacterium]|nr:aromatic ring-hydroxylating dioxygenase subunit alpha [Sphingomonadales bacterium]